MGTSRRSFDGTFFFSFSPKLGNRNSRIQWPGVYLTIPWVTLNSRPFFLFPGSLRERYSLPDRRLVTRVVSKDWLRSTVTLCSYLDLVTSRWHWNFRKTREGSWSVFVVPSRSSEKRRDKVVDEKELPGPSTLTTKLKWSLYGRTWHIRVVHNYWLADRPTHFSKL